MTFYKAFNASIVFCAFVIIPAQAQAQVETVAKSEFNCTYEKQVGKGVVGSFTSSVKSGIISEVTDSRRKKYAIKAAKQALEAGYNYALMEPLQIADRRYRNTYVNRRGDRYQGHLVNGAKYKVLRCNAYDDISAYNLIIKQNGENNSSNGKALVDLRELIAAFDDGKVYSGQRKPQIAAQHLKGIGTRESIAKQHPTMMAALQCSARLRPSSLKNFTAAPSAEQLAQEKQCLSDLRPQAQAVGLDFTALVRDDTANLGYVINRPIQSTSSASPAIAARATADASLWGEGWLDDSREFSGFDGKVLSRADGKRIIVASNSLSETQLLDYAVFISAKRAVNSDLRISVATLEDKTATYREYFEQAKQSLTKSEISQAQKHADDFDRTVEARDISRLEEKIQKDEAKLAQLQQPVSEGPEEFPGLEVFMAQMPDQGVSIEDVKQQMREANALSRATKITKLQQDLSEARPKLSNMQVTYARESAEMQQRVNAVPSASTVVSTSRPSTKEKRSRPLNKGAYRAFETYNSVFILDTALNSKCQSSQLVCADRLQAYNTLGPRLNVNDFTPLSRPVDYKPYLPE